MHLRPDALRAHAASAAALADDLAAFDGPPVWGGPDGIDAVATTVRRVRRELAELRSALLAAADGAQAADEDALRALGRAAQA